MVDRADLFRFDGPALVAFSGGRTSAYLVHQVVEAYGGELPASVVVAFANTGKERPETLAFVGECSRRWAIPIHWIEWRPGKPGFEIVGENSASRDGEPFSMLIRQKRFLPGPRRRFCTESLKVEPMKRLMISLGFERWSNVVGLRYDEGARVLRQLDQNQTRKRRWRTVMPLAKAKIVKADVAAFWSRQPFGLDLQSWEGNCDLCFLKGREILKRIIRDEPQLAAWWKDHEARRGKPFHARETYAGLERETATQPLFPGLFDDEFDAECGLTCAGDAA